MHRRQLLGRAGEALAAAHLDALGLEVRHRNWRPSGSGVRGELDLVALDGPALVLCEVKTRRSVRAGTAADAVGRDKRRRLRRLAALYLQAHPHRGPVRGDVIAITVPDDGDLDGAAVQHLRGVW